ncbi:MAG: GspH/FimT family pseudopilin [Aquisalimonadaceae bacterium]
MPASRGFTLIELVVALVVAGILAVVAIPSFDSFVANQRVKTAGQELMLSLTYARSEAVKRNADVHVQPLGADWSTGWEVITDDDDVLRVTQAEAIAGVEIDGGAVSVVTFQRSGRVNASATFSACDSGNKASERVVTVNASGRAQVTVDERCT